ncbi:hypothetical protein OEA41_008688 [Lepraria neglecta]|uniref:Uncharacterized protein n=1 Tax=Lepraria neglecta TaxID=209136 RepID=A0AAD9Z160_9LECA|nr:hypothetical protein OEA41_008688 [Lepraria neglecta]
MQDSSSQYSSGYLQGLLNQQQFQGAAQMAYNAPTQPLYDDMPPYQSRQPTTEVLSKGFDIPQSYRARDNRRVSGSGAMPQQYPIALYQQRLQYDPTTDLEYSTIASSDPTIDPEFLQAAGAELTDQLDDTQKMQESKGGAQNTLSKETLKGLGDRTTSQCDEMEKLGLVDYQMRVWEEEIVCCKQPIVTSAYQIASFNDYSICPRSKLSAEMSKLEIPIKGLRKRVSSEAVRESGQSRKKVADAPEEEEMDMSDMMAKIKEIAEARRRTEKYAREDGRRVEKRPRMIMRVRCCACEKKARVKYDGACSYCEHTRCPICLVLESSEEEARRPQLGVEPDRSPNTRSEVDQRDR